MNTCKYLALISIAALLYPLSALARDKNQHSVDIPDSVQVGGRQLKPGSYKVEWQGTGPAVQVNFLQDGKTVATAPGTLKMNDDQVIQDDIETQATTSKTRSLKEIDFGHQKEALVFGQSGM